MAGADGRVTGLSPLQAGAQQIFTFSPMTPQVFIPMPSVGRGGSGGSAGKKPASRGMGGGGGGSKIAKDKVLSQLRRSEMTNYIEYKEMLALLDRHWLNALNAWGKAPVKKGYPGCPPAEADFFHTLQKLLLDCHGIREHARREARLKAIYAWFISNK